MTAYEETDTNRYIPPDQYSDGSFDYGLDEVFSGSWSDMNTLISPSIDKTERHSETRQNTSNWYTATTVGVDDAYPGSLMASSCMNISPSSGSVGVQRMMPWPRNTSSGQEGVGFHTPQIAPRSNGSSSNKSSPPSTVAPSPASSLSSRRHHVSWTAGSTSTGDEADVKADVNPPSPLLHVATRSRNHGVMHVLLQRGAVAIDERDAEGRTALHVAAGLGDKTLVGLLLREGADPRLLDMRGRLALYYAVEKGQYEVVEMLLDRAEEE